MKVAIAGSRGVDDHNIVNLAIELSGYQISSVVSGCAKGVDTYGAVWAVENGIQLEEFHAEWETLGKCAGMMRNVDMAEEIDAAIIVWDGKSSGTKHMIQQMSRLGKPHFVYKLSGEYKHY